MANILIMKRWAHKLAMSMSAGVHAATVMGVADFFFFVPFWKCGTRRRAFNQQKDFKI
jgi:hypothetical protein